MPTNFDPNRYVQDLVASFRSKDPEPYLRHYAENAELTDPSTPQPVRGKDAIRKNWEQWSTAFGELEASLQHGIVSGNKAAILIDMKGRHTGDLALGPGETVPATNKTVKQQIAAFLTLDSEGKIVRDQTVFDLASMLQQLGLMPSPQTGAVPPTGRTPQTPARR